MDPINDAYGQEIWSYLKGRESYEIIERDDGFIDISGVVPPGYFKDYEEWPTYQKMAIKYVKGRVLDVGAGAGRVSLYLQKKGFEVLAIDNSPLAIEVCKERGVKNTKILAFKDIDQLNEDIFDSIVLFGNNFGLFGNFHDGKAILKKLNSLTNNNSIIIAESNDPYKTADPVHLNYQELKRKEGKMPGQIKIRARFRNYIGNWFEYLLVSKEEMTEFFKGTGWTVREFIESESSRYIGIMEKDTIS
ncbi:MAG: methyltransferase domain-containing protein [Promethearchaeota archaeon]